MTKLTNAVSQFHARVEGKDQRAPEQMHYFTKCDDKGRKYAAPAEA
jgi:hypothetical protein